MTAIAGVGGVVVISVVTALAIIPDQIMRSIQNIIVVVLVETRRRPSGLSGMTGGTIFRNSQSDVIGIGRLIVILQVTILADGGSSFISILMTIQTIGHPVHTGQRELAHIVIKGHFLFTGGMTGQTGKGSVKISSYPHMVIVGLGIDMASGAGKHFEI